ncbi:MAG: SgcJ/EcaC family oxidoreductase [Gemmatimonadales bacterium]
MIRFNKASILGLSMIALVGCTKSEAPASDTTATAAAATTPDAAADEQAIRAINPAWFKAWNARDVDGVVALYADDAVVSAPGMPPARGTAAIRELFTKDVAGAAQAGVTQVSGTGDFVVSGDLGSEWNTFTVSDKSGAKVDTGKYVTVYARRNGKWVIVRDIWNSDTPPAPTK